MEQTAERFSRTLLLWWMTGYNILYKKKAPCECMFIYLCLHIGKIIPQWPGGVSVSPDCPSQSELCFQCNTT